MNPLFRLIRRLIQVSLITIIIGIGAVVYYMEFELPDIEALNSIQLQTPLQIFSKDKKLIASFGEKRRIPVAYDQIPKSLIQAVLATEDQRYFQHNGVDIPGLGRAALQLLMTGRKSQGGSTITMQVARGFYLTRNKTFARKLREILLAMKIENKLSKEKILELYLNKVFFGNRAYGVEAASQVYYGKHLDELTIDQYAMLAGIPKAPSNLNPLANPTAAKKRRDHVLARMHDQGYIDDATYKVALDAPLNASYHDISTEVKAPYVAELVRQQLEQMYGDSIYTDGFKVYTTIDSRLQKFAEQAVRENLLAYDQRHGYRGPATNLGIPSIDNMQAWERSLSRIYTINGLEAGAVVDMTDDSITVLRANGDLAMVPWSGLSWARKQINADYLGPLPRRAEQIVQLGDVVRINKVGSTYQLAQIPKAQAGMVALSPQNGAILAMVGGFDYQISKFNRMTDARRQPGSSFKPFIYSAALDKGYTLATVINDAPIVIENPYDNSIWRPQNDTHKFYGPTRLRTAIIESRNLVSIRLLALIGLSFAEEYLHRFGFVQQQLPPGLSLALGTALVTPLQLAQAYSVFANGGLKVTPYIIDSITNSQDQVIYQARPISVCEGTCGKDVASAPRVISAQNAFLITSALHDVIQRGTAKLAKNLGRNDIAGKTGTTQNQVDAWFAGYNPDIVAVSWMGFDQQQSLHEYGSKAALPIWVQFIENALKDHPDHNNEQPPGIVSIRIDPYTGRHISAKNGGGIFEYFMLPYVPENAPVDPDAAESLRQSVTDTNNEVDNNSIAADPMTDTTNLSAPSQNTPAYMNHPTTPAYEHHDEEPSANAPTAPQEEPSKPMEPIDANKPMDAINPTDPTKQPNASQTDANKQQPDPNKPNVTADEDEAF